MSNESNGTGRMSMTLTFAPGTNADIAQVQVNNKLSMAEAMLPEAVTRLGIQVQKSTASFLMVVGFTSDDGSLNAGDLGDYLVNTIQDPSPVLRGSVRRRCSAPLTPCVSGLIRISSTPTASRQLTW